MAKAHRLAKRRAADQKMKTLQNQPDSLADEGDELYRGKACIRHALRQPVKSLFHDYGIP